MSRGEEGQVMALIECPECNKRIGEHAHACPTCGFPIANPSPKVASIDAAVNMPLERIHDNQDGDLKKYVARESQSEEIAAIPESPAHSDENHGTPRDASTKLGSIADICQTFTGFQRHLYAARGAA